jgi:hypothetical protein
MKINDFILFFTLTLFLIIYIFLCSYGTLSQISQFNNNTVNKPNIISYNDKLYNFFISIFGIIICMLLIVIEVKYIIPNFENNIYIQSFQFILGLIILGLYYLPTFIQNNYTLNQISFALHPLISAITIMLSLSISIIISSSISILNI